MTSFNRGRFCQIALQLLQVCCMCHFTLPELIKSTATAFRRVPPITLALLEISGVLVGMEESQVNRVLQGDYWVDSMLAKS